MIVNITKLLFNIAYVCIPIMPTYIATYITYIWHMRRYLISCTYDIAYELTCPHIYIWYIDT